MNSEAAAALYETVWLDANQYYDAERQHYEAPQASAAEIQKRPNPGHQSHCSPKQSGMTNSSLAREIEYARQRIQNFLKSGQADTGADLGSSSIISRLERIEQDNEALKKQVSKFTSDMVAVLATFQSELISFQKFIKASNISGEVQGEPKNILKSAVQNGSSITADDDDLDLFGSDEEEDEAAEKLKAERLEAYANKKAKKPALVAKSSVVFDVKPWDDETDMKEMEKAVRAVQSEGLVWGASKLIPLAYSIKKLQIVAIVEDEKVSIDWLQEIIGEIEDLVQSVDIAAFNKL